MRFRIITLLFMALCSFAAEPISTAGLSDAQIAEIRLTVERTKHNNTAASVREEVGAWAELGANVGKAVTSAAKEVGVAAADFAMTPLGKVLVGILILKFLGLPIIGTMLGLLAWAITYVIWRRMTQRVTVLIKHEYKPYLWGMWMRRVVVERKTDNNELSGEAAGITLVIGAFVGAVFLAVGLSHF